MSIAVDLAWAKEVVLKRYVPEKKAMVDVRIYDFNGIRISKNCVMGNKPNCLAWKAKNEKSQVRTVATIPLLGHPASRACQARMGTSLIFIQGKRTEVDYCVFKDNSAINSWDLYYAINKK